MHFNYYFLKQLSSALRPHLLGKKLTACFSQNKDELVVEFSNNFTIKAGLNNDTSFLTFPDQFKRAKKNAVDLFSPIVGLTVRDIVQYQNERSLAIALSEGWLLLFKLHGRRANCCLFHQNTFHSMFKNSMTNDQSLNPKLLDRPIDQSLTALKASGFDLKTTFPTFDKHIYQYLSDKQFDDADISKKETILMDLLSELDNNNFYLTTQHNGKPYLSLLPTRDTLSTLQDPIAACNKLASYYYQTYLLQREKDTATRQLDKQIKKYESYIEKSKNKLNELTHGVKNNEIADILMANLHVKTQHSKSIELFDFYRNQNITIRLKSDQSLQANAESYYRKAKNQKIEVDKLAQNISAKENEIIQLLEQKEQIASADNLKAVRKLTGSTKADSKQEISVPYIEYTIDGKQVWVGKNAKANDLLLRQYTSKNDLWLHARNVSGSHVIIKHNTAENIALATIEKAAQLAAWYSKGKQDTLCPVIYTARKYVNKPKGAEPGKVTVKREEVILVNPCQNPH